MNALKFFNIALIALIISLAISLLTPRPQNIEPNNLTVSVVSDSISIPNTPTLVVHNSRAENFSFHTCEHISLTQNSKSVDIASISPEFCENKEVLAGTSLKFSLEKLHKLFASTPAKYILTLQDGQESKNVAFQVTPTGFVTSFLTNLIYNPIYNLFAFLILSLPGNSLGWAIVIVTIIIRLILLYPQHRMLENTRRMAELNPKIRALQKEYGNDRATLGMKMMELYKKENVSPMGSCLPLLIQFPILIGLYWVIMGITNISNTYHLYPFLKNFNPETINTIFFGQNLLQIGGVTAIILAFVLAGTQWVQAYLAIQWQPPLPPADENKKSDEPTMPTLDPRMMQKLTLYVFPLLIGVSALFFPIGLGLYWWIGLLFMIVQQIFVNARSKKIKEKWEIIKKK